MNAWPAAGVASQLVLSVQTCAQAGFRDRVEAAAAAGYDGIGLRPKDLERAAAEGLDHSGARALLDRHGLRVVELEALFDWALGGEKAASSRAHEERLYELAAAVGGEYLLVNSELDGPLEAAAGRFAALCDRAAERGLRVAIEFLPWTSIPDVSTARRIAELAGRDNGGVLVDTWHLYRGGGREEDLRQVPPERVFAIQLDDADPGVVGTLYEDTLHRRRLPGEGSFPLARFFATLAEMGVRAPVCLEVISDEMASLPAAEAALRSATAARQVLTRG